MRRLSSHIAIVRKFILCISLPVAPSGNTEEFQMGLKPRTSLFIHVGSEQSSGLLGSGASCRRVLPSGTPTPYLGRTPFHSAPRTYLVVSSHKKPSWDAPRLSNCRAARSLAQGVGADPCPYSTPMCP